MGQFRNGPPKAAAERILRPTCRLGDAADMWRSHALHGQRDAANENRRVLSDVHIEEVGQLCQEGMSI